MVAYSGGAWQYTTSFCSKSPCRYVATKSHLRMRMMPAEFAIAAARREVGTHRRAECLIEVNTPYLRASLDA
eukprot:2821664-Pleurochrysis_carterae.AAC.2